MNSRQYFDARSQLLMDIEKFLYEHRNRHWITSAMMKADFIAWMAKKQAADAETADD